MISVILPVYNAVKTLRRVIDSVLNQSYTDFELVVVDDGSNDGSAQIADEYASKDHRIKVFHKSNGGSNSARNYALDNINGEYVTFCDADDYVDDNWLQAFVDHLEEAGVVVQGWKYIGETICESRFEDALFDAATSADMMSARESFGFLWNKCFKVELIRNACLRFDERFRFLEDEEFVCRYWTLIKQVKLVNNASYNYLVPDFNNKYRDVDNFYLYQSLLDNASSFIHKTESVTMQKYTMGVFRSMMLAYEHKQYLEGWKRLRLVAAYSRMFCQYNKYMKYLRLWNCSLWHLGNIFYSFWKKM